MCQLSGFLWPQCCTGTFPQLEQCNGFQPAMWAASKCFFVGVWRVGAALHCRGGHAFAPCQLSLSLYFTLCACWISPCNWHYVNQCCLLKRFRSKNIFFSFYHILASIRNYFCLSGMWITNHSCCAMSCGVRIAREIGFNVFEKFPM